MEWQAGVRMSGQPNSRRSSARTRRRQQPKAAQSRSYPTKSAGASAAAAIDQRYAIYCKKCDTVFAQKTWKDKCPGGHANFMYSKRIPADRQPGGAPQEREEAAAEDWRELLYGALKDKYGIDPRSLEKKKKVEQVETRQPTNTAPAAQQTAAFKKAEVRSALSAAAETTSPAVAISRPAPAVPAAAAAQKKEAQSSSSAEFGGPVDGRWRNAVVPAALKSDGFKEFKWRKQQKAAQAEWEAVHRNDSTGVDIDLPEKQPTVVSQWRDDLVKEATVQKKESPQLKAETKLQREKTETCQLNAETRPQKRAKPAETAEIEQKRIEAVKVKSDNVDQQEQETQASDSDDGFATASSEEDDADFQDVLEIQSGWYG